MVELKYFSHSGQIRSGCPTSVKALSNCGCLLLSNMFAFYVHYTTTEKDKSTKTAGSAVENGLLSIETAKTDC